MSLETKEKKPPRDQQHLSWWREPNEIPFMITYKGCYYLFMGGTIILFASVYAGMSAYKDIKAFIKGEQTSHQHKS